VDTTKKYDVIIIGGGPAGMSSAVWCSDLGLEPLLIDKSDRLGGQLWWIHNPISNYLGIQTANGVTISYLRTGGDKPSAVLLHGLDVRVERNGVRSGR